MTKLFAIMGATGQIGRGIVEDLLKRGHRVRAFGRNEIVLQQLTDKGAEAIAGEFDDADTLSRGFQDAYAVFSMIPPSHHEQSYSEFQERVSKAICSALKNAQIARIVNLSSMGAQLTDNTGPIKGLHKHETRLDQLKNFTSLVHLRPTYFMENLYSYIPTIQSRGIMASSLAKNLRIPMVATRDIAWKAADFLDSTAPFKRMIFEFVGPKEVTMEHAALLLGQAFDKPDLEYQEISTAQEKQKMLTAGMSPETTEMMLEMYQAFNQGLIKPTQPLKLSHHGTTTLEEEIQMIVHKRVSLGKN